MEFLTREFESLPDELVAALLKQLEEIIRQASHTMQYTTSDDLQRIDLRCIALCGKLSAVINLAQRLKTELRDKDNSGTPE